MPKKTRLTLDMTPVARRKLETLRKSRGCASAAHVVRVALDVLSVLTKCSARGDAIIVRRPDGSETELLLASW